MHAFPIPVAAEFGGAHLLEFLPPVLASVTYLTLFAVRSRTLAREGRGVPTWRIVSFISGVVLAAAVQLGPLDSLADDVLVAHMLQHIVISDIASRVIVFGLT